MIEEDWVEICPKCKEQNVLTIRNNHYIKKICTNCSKVIQSEEGIEVGTYLDHDLLLVIIEDLVEYIEQATFCAYCGHQYPKGTPNSQNEELTAHIKVCEKHPMRKLENQIRQIKDTLFYFSANQNTEKLIDMISEVQYALKKERPLG